MNPKLAPSLGWSLLIAGLFVLSACKGPTSEAASRAEASAKSAETLVVTSVSQSSHGATADDIDAEFVSMMEEHFVESAEKHYKSAMANMGYPGESAKYEAGTVLFDEEGNKLAVTTLTPAAKGPITVSKVAWWIADGEIKRAICADTAGNEVPIRFGPCAAKIAEVFGYKNWQLDSRLP